MHDSFKVDFLGIGPSKAGTTWLGHMLEAHPQICMGEPKEVHYFNDSISVNKLYKAPHYPLGLEWYKKHFTHCAKDSIKGEVTPRYIIDPVVPQRLFDHNSDLKLIVCLRNPYNRIVSHYHSARDYHQSVEQPISEAIRDVPEFIEASKYYQNISRFLPLFSLDSIFFVEMEAVRTRPQELVSELYTFLGVDPDFIPKGINDKSNPARRVKNVGFRKLVGNIHRQMIVIGLSPLIQWMKKAGIGKALNNMNSRPIDKVTLSETDRQYIRSHIEEDVAQLGKLLQRDFSHWHDK